MRQSSKLFTRVRFPSAPLIFSNMCKYSTKFTIKQLREQYPDDDACLDKIFKLVYGEMTSCPKCGCAKPYKRVSSRRCYQCLRCYHQIYPTAGSIFHKTTTPLTYWFFTIYLFTTSKNGLSACELQRHLGVTYKTAFRMLKQIRTLIHNDEFILSGVVEADESFVGGKNKNRHRDKKVKKSQGRSFKDKTPVLGLVQRSEYHYIERPNKVNPHKVVREKVITKLSHARCYVISNTAASSIQPLVLKSVQPNSSLMTDEWLAYNGMNKYFTHGIVDHSRGQYVDGEKSTNAAENLWSNFKRALKGTYIHVSNGYLQLYVNESVFRYNHRDKGDMFHELLSCLSS